MYLWKQYAGQRLMGGSRNIEMEVLRQDFSGAYFSTEEERGCSGLKKE